jgi:VanZ family protein
MRAFVSKWMPVIAWMILIFAGSTDVLSAEQTSRFLVPFLHWLDPQMSWATIREIHFAVRKLGHLTEYAVLAMLLWRGLRGTLSVALLKVGLIAAVVAAVFAALDEFHQSFVPSRTSSANDVMIDICGAIVGLIVCWMFAQRNVARKQAAIASIP